MVLILREKPSVGEVDVTAKADWLTLKSKEVHHLAARVEEVFHRRGESAPSENKEKCHLLDKQLNVFASEEKLPNSIRKTISATSDLLDHFDFLVENPVVEELDAESPIPNFATRLKETADKIRETKSLAPFFEELDSDQQKQVLAMLESK